MLQHRQKEISKMQEQHNKPSISEELDRFQPLLPAGVGAPDSVAEAIVTLVWYVKCKSILCFSNLVNWHIFVGEPSHILFLC